MSAEDDVGDAIERHRNALAVAVVARRKELLLDDTTHYEAYRYLGVPPAECETIDLYQNVGRFVYKYAGSLLEEVTKIVISATGDGSAASLPNTVSANPVNFEIDCYTQRDNRAHEIKWRDATTDGDHIRKETNKVRTIDEAGMIPVRIMFYMPVRSQARRIQEKIIALYREFGYAYVGEKAWDYVEKYSGIDLRAVLRRFDYPHPDWIEVEHAPAEENWQGELRH